MRNLVFALLLVIATACTKSNEQLIKKEFKDYIKQNFDDPKSVKEIVSIEPYDTLSLRKFVGVTKDGLSTMAQLDSMCEATMTQSLAFMQARTPKLQYGSNRYTGIRLLSDMIDATNDEYKCRPMYRRITEKVQIYIDSLAYEAPLYGYKIKFRQISNKEPRMVEYCGFVDSLTRKVTIYPDDVPIKHCSASIKKLMEYNEEITNAMNTRLQNIKKHDESLAELKIMLY